MSIRVLAIDDSKTIRMLLQAAFETADYDVCLAEDGLEGLEKLSDYEPDVVVTDINMPRLDGFGVISGVRSHDTLGTIPVLVLSTESSDTLKTKARDLGATGWIVKPFDGPSLIAAIERVAA